MSLGQLLRGRFFNSDQRIQESNYELWSLDRRTYSYDVSQLSGCARVWAAIGYTLSRYHNHT